MLDNKCFFFFKKKRRIRSKRKFPRGRKAAMSTSNRISRIRVSSLSSTRFLRWLPTRQAATRSIGRFHATRFEFQPILTLFTSTRTSVVSSCHCTLPHACITGRRPFRLHKYRIDASSPAAKRLSPRSSCSKIGNVRVERDLFLGSSNYD